MSKPTHTPSDQANQDARTVDVQLTGTSMACLTVLETLHAAGIPVANACSLDPIGRDGRLIRIHADITTSEQLTSSSPDPAEQGRR